MARTAANARLFAIGYGVVYLLVTALGFVVGDGGYLLSIIPINTADNLLHLAHRGQRHRRSAWRARPPAAHRAARPRPDRSPTRAGGATSVSGPDRATTTMFVIAHAGHLALELLQFAPLIAVAGGRRMEDLDGSPRHPGRG